MFTKKSDWKSYFKKKNSVDKILEKLRNGENITVEEYEILISNSDSKNCFWAGYIFGYNGLKFDKK